MLVKVYGSSILGVKNGTTAVEKNLHTRLSDDLVWLFHSAVNKKNSRVPAAFKNVENQLLAKKIPITMAPAHWTIKGSAEGVPAALGALLTSHQISTNKKIAEFENLKKPVEDMGLKSIRGVLPRAKKAKQKDFRGDITPEQQISETIQYLILDRENYLG